MRIYDDITETIGRTPLIRLGQVTAGTGAEVAATLESFNLLSRVKDRIVSALAGPSEVLVSGTVKDLVAGSGIQFVEYGRRVLKGVPGERRLVAVA